MEPLVGCLRFHLVALTVNNGPAVAVKHIGIRMVEEAEHILPDSLIIDNSSMDAIMVILLR